MTVLRVHRILVATLVVGVTLALNCSQAVAVDPVFKVHVIEKNSPLVEDSVMSCTLSDLDGDGDLDWTAGTIWPRRPRERMLYWYEYQGPDKWVRHSMGDAPNMYGGACTADVNGDGHMDVVATDLWLNKGGGSGWSFHVTGIPGGLHDMQAVDFNGDGKLDFLVFDQKNGVLWYESPADLRKKWVRHSIAGSNYAGGRVHTTGAPSGAADLDGDGDVDVAAIKGWFENKDGKGREWLYRKNDLFPTGTTGKKGDFPWGYGVKTVVRDMDTDGDMDVVQSGCDTLVATDIVWLENTNGKGDFRLHAVKEGAAEDYHTLDVIDYDNDGDWDVFSGVGPLSKQKKHAYLFENLAGKGRKPRWKEHVIHSGMTVHEGVAGDVDRDGDVDIIIKPWNHKDNPKDFLYLENRIVE